MQQVGRLRFAMRRLLSSRSLATTRRQTVDFRHDCFRYLFNCFPTSRALTEFSLNKFPPAYFPADWYVYRRVTGDRFYARNIFLTPRLRKSKPTYAAHPAQPDVLVPVPETVLYSEVVSLKVIVLPL